MKSKTKIAKQLQRKTNDGLVKTILAAKKEKAWLNIAEELSKPKRKRNEMNLNEIDEKIKNEKKVLVLGKVLSQGEIDKKIKVIALNFSEKAREKLLKAGCEISTIIEEIKSNPSMKEVKILK